VEVCGEEEGKGEGGRADEEVGKVRQRRTTTTLRKGGSELTSISPSAGQFEPVSQKAAVKTRGGECRSQHSRWRKGRKRRNVRQVEHP
jgi:hypothetical protein